MKKWIKYTYLRVYQQHIDVDKLVIGTFGSVYLSGAAEYFVDSMENAEKYGHSYYVPLKRFIKRISK